MAIQTIQQIKAWFRKGSYPTETQFSDTWDSFFHKNENIPVSKVDNLTGIINAKADAKTVQEQAASIEALSYEVDNRIPLAGTSFGKPVTGDIDFANYRGIHGLDKLYVTAENFINLEANEIGVYDGYGSSMRLANPAKNSGRSIILDTDFSASISATENIDIEGRQSLNLLSDNIVSIYGDNYIQLGSNGIVGISAGDSIELEANNYVKINTNKKALYNGAEIATEDNINWLYSELTNKYLPLSGGELSGDLIFSAGKKITGKGSLEISDGYGSSITTPRVSGPTISDILLTAGDKMTLKATSGISGKTTQGSITLSKSSNPGVEVYFELGGASMGNQYGFILSDNIKNSWYVGSPKGYVDLKNENMQLYATKSINIAADHIELADTDENLALFYDKNQHLFKLGFEGDDIIDRNQSNVSYYGLNGNSVIEVSNSYVAYHTHKGNDLIYLNEDYLMVSDHLCYDLIVSNYNGNGYFGYRGSDLIRSTASYTNYYGFDGNYLIHQDSNYTQYYGHNGNDFIYLDENNTRLYGPNGNPFIVVSGNYIEYKDYLDDLIIKKNVNGITYYDHIGDELIHSTEGYTGYCGISGVLACQSNDETVYNGYNERQLIRSGASSMMYRGHDSVDLIYSDQYETMYHGHAGSCLIDALYDRLDYYGFGNRIMIISLEQSTCFFRPNGNQFLNVTASAVKLDIPASTNTDASLTHVIAQYSNGSMRKMTKADFKAWLNS